VRASLAVVVAAALALAALVLEERGCMNFKAFLHPIKKGFEVSRGVV